MPAKTVVRSVPARSLQPVAGWTIGTRCTDLPADAATFARARRRARAMPAAGRG